MKRKAKRFLSLLLMAALVFTLLPPPARAESAVWDGTLSRPGGEGTSASHYMIDTAEELAWFADKVNTGSEQTLYADLADNIMLNDTSNWTSWASAQPANVWIPIGSSVNSNRVVFDGCGYAVSGLYVNSTENYAGLFGYIGKNSSGFESEVRNLALKESYIKGAQYAGGICGYLHQSNIISGCSSNATVAGTGQYTGGIAGFVYHKASITACQNTGNVSGNQYVGGIAGKTNYTSSITGCKNEGAINAASTYAGGIAGNNSGTMTNAYNIAAVSGSGYIGGICGYNDGAVSHVYSTGVITGTTDTGKVCGQNTVLASLTSAWFSGNSTDKGVGTNYGTASVYYASAAQFSSGEAAYLLGGAFGQELGTDSFPVFRSPDGSNTVYKLTYTVDSTEYAVQYYNAGDTVSASGIADPTMEGGYFVSWTGLPAAMPESDLTVTANFNTGVSPAPKITTESLPVGYKDAAYSAAISATGQTPITFSLSGGTSLPSGLALNGSTGVILGTPAETGAASFTIEASNAVGPPDTHDYTLTVSEPTPVITTASLPAGYKGEAYSAAITVAGPGTITYALDSATPLPDGLTLDGATGAIMGTPAEAGSFTVRFMAESEYGDDEATLTLPVQIRMVGSGTQSDPYQISTADQMVQFAAIASSDASKSYYAGLMNDIALNDTSAWGSWGTTPPANQWTPIGSGPSSFFRGVFDGRNHTISGVYVKQSGDYAGLFGYITIGGTAIKNLTLSESYIEGSNYVGGICGYLGGNATTAIENCKSAATVAGNQYVGGICGGTISGANVRGCQNSGSVTGNQYVGGIVGQNYGNVSGCRNSGGISPRTYPVQVAFGGIVGHNYGAVADSYNQGALVCPLANNIGGVCGTNTGTITNAYNTGYILGVSNTTGKLCGSAAAASVLTNCYFLGIATDAGVGTNSGSGTATVKSAAQFVSGEAAYLLGSAFGQELGGNAEAYPVFRSPDGSNAVYKLTYMANSAEYAVQYYNAGDTISTAGIPNPTIEDGYFTVWSGLPAAMPERDLTVTAGFNSGTYEAPEITTGSLPGGYAGIEYSAAVSATGSGIITFSLSGATSLPGGLTLNASTGVISGTPSGAGTTSFTIEASNGWGGTDTRSFIVTISEPAPVITTASLPTAYRGEAYSASVAAAGHGTITYMLDSATPLPGGLTFDGTTGAITGTPAETGSFTVKFIAANIHGSDEATLTLPVQIRMAGSGTQSDPYRISTADQMFQFAALVNSDTSKAYYAELMNDIALNDTSAWESWATAPPANPWTPVGTGPASFFKGVFDGGNHTISGVYIKQTGDYAGLFGQIAAADTAIKDLTLSESYIEGASYVGGICGYLAVGGTAAIENCKSAATVVGSEMVGGICGYAMVNSTVLNCQNSGSVTGGQYVGGIAGMNYGGISGCRNSGAIASTAASTNGNAFGGICGFNNGAVTNCYNAGTVNSPASTNAGGICGNNLKLITNAYNVGAVTGISSVGKICGFGGPPSVLSGCFFLGGVTEEGIGNSGTYKGSGTATVKSAAQFASGEVAYLLGSAFGQDLGGSADAYPVFRLPDGSNTVYKLTYMVDSAEYAAQYYNAGDTVSAAGIAEPIVSGSRFSNWQNLQATMPGEDVTVSAVFLTVSATVDPTGKTFPEVIENYGQQTAQQFTVTNTGESEITGLSASLSGGTASAFEISAALSADTLNASGTAAVSVRPKTGLAANTYTDTLAITGDNGISLTVSLSFMVNATSSPVRLTTPTGLVWGGTVPGKAKWTAVPNASSYTVWLYKGGSAQGGPVTSVTDPEYDFTSVIASAGSGSYTFRVTAIGDGVSYTNSDLSDESTAYTYALPVTDAAISPDTGSFDKYAPADVQTTITWGSATGVTDVKAGGVTISTGNYTVSGDTLTIKKEYLAAQAGSLVLTVEFNAGASATLTIAISDTTPPIINPASRIYDLSAPDDVITNIVWNSAVSVTDVVYGIRPDPIAYTLNMDDYAIIDNDLTIKNSFLGSLSLTTGAALDFIITFNTGNTATLTVNVEDGHVPGSNANLSSLSVNGTPVSGFDPDVTTYDVVLPYGASSVTVTATTEDPYAGHTITQAPLLPGSAMVTVTAEDKTTTRTYTINLTVGAPTVTTYTVIFNSNGSVYITKTVNVGESIGNAAWPADPVRSSYRFGGWFTGENGTGARFTPATPVNAAMTVYAEWTYSGRSRGPSTPIYNADVKAGNGAKTTLPVTVDRDAGTASIDAGSQSVAQGGTVITIPAIPNVDAYSVGIPVPELQAADGRGTLTLNTAIGSVTVPSDMLTGVSGISGSRAEISIGKGDKSTLPDDVKAAIGGRPLISLTLSIDGRQTDWSNPDAPVTVSIPYTPTAGELANSESIVIWYIDGSGNPQCVTNGRYDPAAGTVTFFTTHFSDYAVAYNKASFSDAAADAWYAKAVSFIAAREITSGTGNGNYSPDAKLTRGEFIVLMMRAYGIAPDTNTADNFSDAGNAYYTGYLAAAKRLGITAGVGDNKYAPTAQITRQEMFILLYNGLKVIGQLPEGDSGKTVIEFTDAAQISTWAQEAMSTFVVTGTVGGSGGKLDPTGATTRAEMAQVLYNLLGK